MALNEINFGRWLTPDLLGGDTTNPQSLNRYAYALNNPTTLTNPLGLQAGDDECDNGWEPNPVCQGASGSGINGCGPDIFGFCPLWIAGAELNIGIASSGGGSTGTIGSTKSTAMPPGNGFIHNPLVCLTPAQQGLLRNFFLGAAAALHNLPSSQVQSGQGELEAGSRWCFKRPNRDPTGGTARKP